MKLLFLGCGELGSRHIQAASQLSGNNQIFIVDPSKYAKLTCKSIIDNTSNVNKHTEFKWYNKLNFKSHNFDLCVISTHSIERAELLKEVHKKFSIKKYLIEKNISNSRKKIFDLNRYAKKHGLNIWVNCKTRTYQINKKNQKNNF